MQKINDIDEKYKRYINSGHTEVEYPTLGITAEINLETGEVKYFKDINDIKEKISLSSVEKEEIELIDEGYISNTICKTSIITKSDKEYKKIGYPTLGITAEINLETGKMEFFKGVIEFSSLDLREQDDIIEEVHKYDKGVFGCFKGLVPFCELSILLLIEAEYESKCVICVPNREKPIEGQVECVKKIVRDNLGETVCFCLDDKKHMISGFATFINGKFYMTLINTSMYRGFYNVLWNNMACIAEFNAQNVGNCVVVSPRTSVEFAKQFREKDATQAIIFDMEKIRDSKVSLGGKLRILNATANAFAIKENYFCDEAISNITDIKNSCKDIDECLRIRAKRENANNELIKLKAKREKLKTEYEEKEYKYKKEKNKYKKANSKYKQKYDEYQEIDTECRKLYTEYEEGKNRYYEAYIEYTNITNTYFKMVITKLREKKEITTTNISDSYNISSSLTDISRATEDITETIGKQQPVSQQGFRKKIINNYYI